MDDKTLAFLQALAAKLGTTAEYLWGVLLRQAPISGGITPALIVLAWAAIIGGMRYTHNKVKRREWHADGEAVPAFVILGVCSIFAVLGTSFESRDAITAIINPEYWALKQVLSFAR